MSAEFTDAYTERNIGWWSKGRASSLTSSFKLHSPLALINKPSLQNMLWTLAECIDIKHIKSRVFQPCFSKVPGEMEPSVVLQSHPHMKSFHWPKTNMNTKSCSTAIPWTDTSHKKIHTSEKVEELKYNTVRVDHCGRRVKGPRKWSPLITMISETPPFHVSPTSSYIVILLPNTTSHIHEVPSSNKDSTRIAYIAI